MSDNSGKEAVIDWDKKGELMYSIEKTNKCPLNKPWGIIRQDGKLVACYANRFLAEQNATQGSRAVYIPNTQSGGTTGGSGKGGDSNPESVP